MKTTFLFHLALFLLISATAEATEIGGVKQALAGQTCHVRINGITRGASRLDFSTSEGGELRVAFRTSIQDPVAHRIWDTPDVERFLPGSAKLATATIDDKNGTVTFKNENGVIYTLKIEKSTISGTIDGRSRGPGWGVADIDKGVCVVTTNTTPIAEKPQ